jgi:hypothetical protein
MYEYKTWRIIIIDIQISATFFHMLIALYDSGRRGPVAPDLVEQLATDYLRYIFSTFFRKEPVKCSYPCRVQFVVLAMKTADIL